MSDTRRGFCQLPKALAARRDLFPSDKIVWAVIVDRIGDNESAWPGTRRIAKDSGLNRGTVKAAIRRLSGKGLLDIEPGRDGDTNRYRVGGSIADPGQPSARASGETRGGSGNGPKRTHGTNPPTSHAANQNDVVWDGDSERFIVTPEQLGRWKRDFPSVNVEVEIAKAGAWHGANRKWRSRFKAALTRWLGRAAAPQIGAQPTVDTGDEYARLLQGGRSQ